MTFSREFHCGIQGPLGIPVGGSGVRPHMKSVRQELLLQKASGWKGSLEVT